MAEIKVGKITHYFNKIGVAIVEIEDSFIEVGDTIKIIGHDREFEQPVESIQVEHKPVNRAERGDVVGLKVSQTVKEGDEIYKITAD